jgi:CheY-like chemotaxis protein
MPGTVLLIDDEPSLAAALVIRLRAAGYRVCTAMSGAAGLDAAKADRPDAVLLDIRMPGVNGYEVCRRMKADPQLASIPVLFMSANVLDAARRTAFEVGGADFLPKPFVPGRVLAALASAMGPPATAMQRRCA